MNSYDINDDLNEFDVLNSNGDESDDFNFLDLFPHQLTDFDYYSIDEMEQQAQEGNFEFMIELAQEYLNGGHVQQNSKKSAYWMEKAASEEYSEAQFNIGLYYAKGFGVERNFDKAIYWMQKATDNGDTDAENFLDHLLKAKEDIERANQDDVDAQTSLGEFYMFLGEALNQCDNSEDFDKALYWTNKAIENGSAHAYYILALAYHNGRGVAQDMQKAIEAYKKGIALGDAPCMHNYACLHINNEIENPDLKLAYNLCKKACESGYDFAYQTLGCCYDFAYGTERNKEKAIECYKKFLENNYNPAVEEAIEYLNNDFSI